VFDQDEFAATEEDRDQLRRLFPSRGCLYAAIRRPPLLEALPHLAAFRVILLLRDPRDCLTSLFFSLAYSHRPPGDDDRKEAFFTGVRRPPIVSSRPGQRVHQK
jgi:hypothetical protein